MLRSSHVPAHRATCGVRRAADARTLTGATALAVWATAAAYALTPGALPTAAAQSATFAASQLATPAPAGVATRSEAPRASRADARAALTAVSAPRTEGPTVAAYGTLGLKAVAKPKPKVVASPATGASTATAATGSAPAASTPSGGSTSSYAAAGAALGLAPSAAAVYSAIRSTFGITNIGGYRAGDWGDHGTGHAVDVMITSAAQGNAVAAYAIANMGRLNIKYIIWQQRIWMGSGWRLMEDRGSITQNHFDHVHISVN